MLNLTKPQYVMPVHGDHKRLRLHAELAEAVGIPPKSIFRGENGLPLEIDSSGARWGEREQAGLIFVDGMEVGDIEDVALRDRRMLSADGIFIVVATISEQDGRSVVPPEIIFRGVPFVEESDSFVDELRVQADAPVVAVKGHHVLRRGEVDHHLHLLRVAVAGGVDGSVAVRDHVGAQLVDAVDRLVHRALVARDRAGGEDHGVAGVEVDVGVVAMGHPA